MQVSRLALAAFSGTGHQQYVEPYQFPLHPPGVVPASTRLAMDEIMPAPTAMPVGFSAPMGGVGGIYGSFGFPFLTELAQRPEYRKMSSTIATEMVRAWIELQTVGDDKADKIAQINDEMNRLRVRDCFGDCAEKDGLFGGAHIYIDTGDTNDPMELALPIGDGSDQTSKQKIGSGGLKSIRTVEPIWCYPQGYSTQNPLKSDWYRPSVWGVMGQTVHASRLLTMIGRPVPDYLKAAYSFRGLSLSQMAYPYVENWIRTRQSVSDIIHSFSVFVLETDLGAIMQGGAGDSLAARLNLFNMTRDNLGVMAINKETEGFDNVAAPLSGLDALQAQSQEQMSSVSSIPLSILLGITPSGLNASSEGEIRIFYDFIHAYQERLFRQPLTTIINFIQLSLFGEVDPAITFRFVPLWSMSEAERATVRKTEAETAQIHIDSGVISPEEERRRVANDPDTLYHGLDVEDVPDLSAEEAEGLEPKGESGEDGSLDHLFRPVAEG